MESVLAFYLFKLANKKMKITISVHHARIRICANVTEQIQLGRRYIAIIIVPHCRDAFGRLSTVEICIYSNACAIGYTHTLGKNFECPLFPPSTSLATTKPPLLFSSAVRLFQTFDRYLLLKWHFAAFWIFLNVRTFRVSRYYFSELQSFILRYNSIYHFL